MQDSDILDLDLAGIIERLETGHITSVELVLLYLNRIAFHDRKGIRLNAVPVLNPSMFADAARMDDLRAKGEIVGPLHGIPFVIKDSFKAKGLTVAAGSPAFADLIASDDAASVARLKEAGAIVIGKTNMPPMAIGGGQRSLYGRTTSPYNGDYLAAAWHSGSSIGSGVAVAANFAPIGLGEETVSSGRSPASNNGLVAYTPSRGLVSIRGNWPLFVLRDTVVPYTRSMRDMISVIAVISRPDSLTEGDIWRQQADIALPSHETFWPKDFSQILEGGSLKGMRIGVPKMYVGEDHLATHPIAIRPSIKALWQQARTVLEERGADITLVDFPVVSEYECDRPGTSSFVDRELLPKGWNAIEIGDLIASAWQQFLHLNDDVNCRSLENIVPAMIHPDPPEAVDTRRMKSAHEGKDEINYETIIAYGVKSPGRPLEEFSQLRAVMKGLETARKELLEDWMQENDLDMIVFPANCDISRDDAEGNRQSSDFAWENGVVFSNMNHVMRHLGIPSVSVPMGIAEDTAMPVNLTFAGKGWDDIRLLGAAYDYEQASKRRQAPKRTTALLYPDWKTVAGSGSQEETEDFSVEMTASARLLATGDVAINVEANPVGTASRVDLTLYIDGEQRHVAGESFTIDLTLGHERRAGSFSSIVCVLARSATGTVRATYADIAYR